MVELLRSIPIISSLCCSDGTYQCEINSKCGDSILAKYNQYWFDNLSAVTKSLALTSASVFKNKFRFGCFDPERILQILEMNTFQGDLTDVSAIKNHW